MAKFILSAFTDEYSKNFDEQLVGMAENGLKYMEIRGVDGTNIADITLDKAKELKAKLDAHGMAVSSMGSPIGKIKITDPMEPHLEQLKHVCELAHILECDRIRMFSFFIPKEEDPANYRSQVMDRLGQMLKVADAEAMTLCHENEKAIYGDIATRCLDIQKEFDSKIKLVFDHANFICCDDEPFPKAYEMLKDYIYYMHIKDATPAKQMAPAGEGIGRIPETIKELNKYDKTFFLTAEPHLRVFSGLDKLEGANELTFERSYASSAEAFKVAIDAIKACVEAAQK